ncbi:Rz1 family lipoprotein, partial [Escherichia coli]
SHPLHRRTPPAWIMQPPPDWQTPLNGIISPSGNDW